MIKAHALWFPLCVLLGLSACNGAAPPVESAQAQSSQQKTLTVTASAYTSRAEETDDTPDLAAWGDTLKPGMKAIAVSRDLIPMGLSHNTPVTISGLSGTYRVLDKMNKRWKKKIDIYMGKDVEAARSWGKQSVTISWSVPAKAEP